MSDAALQNDLFSPPLARRDDPDTSKTAADRISFSGKLDGERAKTLKLVRRYPGHTAVELSQLSRGELDRYQLNKRLAELRNRVPALVDNGAQNHRLSKRPCRLTGNPALLWYPL